MRTLVYNSADLGVYLQQCRPRTNVKKVVTRLLGGSYTVQQIGTGATSVDIQLVCSKETREQIEDISLNGGVLTAIWDEDSWSGVIEDEEIDWEPFSHGSYAEQVSFTLLVIS